MGQVNPIKVSALLDGETSAHKKRAGVGKVSILSEKA